MTETSVLSRLWEVIPTVSVGVLAADLSCLGSEIERLQEAGARLLHVDVMDGCFVPKMTVGPPVVKAMQTPLLKDVHLMIEDPVDKVAEYARAGADMITLHLESGRHLHRALQVLAEIHGDEGHDGRHMVRGIAINPSTPVEAVEPFLDEADMITLLAVNPGWSGQTLIPSTYRRFECLKRMIHDSGRDILTMLDGGINRKNIGDVSELEPDIVVSGSAIFAGDTPRENLEFMIDALRRGTASGGNRVHV